MAEKETSPETPVRKQRAATPKRPTRKRKPKAESTQTAATPGAPHRGRRARQLPPLTPSLIEHFGGQERLELVIAENVPDDATPSDVLRLLLEAKRLGADILRGDVYLARDFSRNGADGGYTVAAKRDTLLRYANTLDDFLGHDERAIFAEDEFEHGEPDADGKTLAKRAGITHKSAMPGKRGDCVGAWCAVDMRDEPPTVRVLDAARYVGTKAERDTLDPEDPKRRHPDGCMIAAAMSSALRIGASLNDVVGAEELTKRPEPLPDLSQRLPPPLFEDGPHDELDGRILNAYREAAALDPMMWTPAKISARVASARAVADENETLFDEMRTTLAMAIEGDVQMTIAARRDPAALERRLRELRAFDPSTLDEETLREYRTERTAVEAAARAAGISVDAA